MRVLLIYCNSMLENALPIGICQLSSCLKQANISVELFDTTFYKHGGKSDMENRIEALQFPPCPLNFIEGEMESEFIKKIENFQPDLLGFSIVEPTFGIGLRLLESARKVITANKIRVAMGGVHAILAPETIINNDLVDYICISEGESAFVELCLKISNGENTNDVRGFWIKQNKDWIKSQTAPLVDLDKLPGLDFTIFSDLFLKKPMMGRLYRTISIETSRGCAYKCSYCGDHALRKLFKGSGSWYRKKSLQHIEEELKEYVKVYNPEFVYFMSEVFLAGRLEKIEEFAALYKQFQIPFWFNTRPEDITKEKIKLLKEIGCKRISIGLEHGNENFRKKYLHRNYSNKTFLGACEILKEFDISFSTNIIIGFPFETREMIFESIELLREIKPDGVSTHIYNPYHGTETRDIAVSNGMINSDLIADDFFQSYPLNNPTITKNEIMGLFRTIPLYIEMDKKLYPKIKVAEQFDNKGNKIFSELKKEYYELKGWKE